MTKYRCKHTVEAMRWDGFDMGALRAFADGKSDSGNWRVCAPGQWLVWSSGEFLVMDDEQFRETYEPVT